MRRILRGLPLALAALTLTAGALLLMANLVTSAVSSPIKLVPGLAGVTAPQRVQVSWDDVLSGRTQAGLAHWIGTQLPLYPWAVRLRDQVGYSVFGTSPLPAVLVGRDGNLIERIYATEWCSRDLAAWRPGAEAWAARIRAIQDRVEARGHTFLYVLTPSKVAQYPDLLPADFSCPAPAADRYGLLPAWRAMLAGAGVHVADTTAALSAAHGDYPFRLYPPGGTHWNAVGEAIGQRTILGALDRALPGRGLAPGSFTWHMTPRATGTDLDLARLMNLFQPVGQEPVPGVRWQEPPPQAACRPPRVVVIGGSFAHAVLTALGRVACPVSAVEYEYWTAYTLRWDGHSIAVRDGVDAEARDAAVLGADVLILEENEEVLRHPFHGKSLDAFLAAQPNG